MTTERMHFVTNLHEQQAPPLAEGLRRESTPELSLLVSFYYFARWNLRRIHSKFPGIKLNLFVDSGGFSAATCGGVVRLKDYAAWVEKNRQYIDVYANLDVIGDPEKTARNQAILESEGLRPVPVFHVGSDFKHLEAILERGYDYIAFGGMVPYLRGSAVPLMKWLHRAFSFIDPTKTRVHGFGVGTTWRVARDYPWFSIDSSAWTSVFQFRVASVFDEGRGDFVQIDLGSMGKGEVLKYGSLIRSYGFSPNDFYPASKFTYPKAGVLSVMSVLRAERYLRARAHLREAKLA